MMDTSTEFPSITRKKKFIIYKCYDCPRMVFYNSFGYYCQGINLPHEKDRNIVNPKKIPSWCPLDDE